MECFVMNIYKNLPNQNDYQNIINDYKTRLIKYRDPSVSNNTIKVPKLQEFYTIFHNSLYVANYQKIETLDDVKKLCDFIEVYTLQTDRMIELKLRIESAVK